MKKLLIFLTLSLFTFKAKAIIGVFAGVNYAETTALYASPKFGYVFGFSVQKKIYKHLGFISGIQKESKGYINSDNKVNINYFSIPTNFIFTDKCGKGRILLFAGTTLSYANGGKIRNIPDNKIIGNLSIGNSSNDDIKPFDFGVNLGLGYKTPKNILVKLQFTKGILNIRNTENVFNNIPTTNQSLSLVLGYILKQ